MGDAPTVLAAGPAAWIAGPLAAHQARHDAAHGVPEDRPGAAWSSWAEVRAAGLVGSHAALVAEGASAVSAAKRIAAWFAGSVADAVGYSHAVGGVGLLPFPADLRWRLGDDGTPERVHLGRPGVVVVPGHPWAGRPDVRVLADDDQVAEATVAALERACAPVLEAVRELARVGRSALWTEVADCVGLSVTHDRDVPVAATVVARLGSLTTTPAAPWRRHPTVWTTPGDRPLYVGRRAGCCLSYQDRTDDGLAAETCGTCSLRTSEDCERAQRAWHHAVP